MAVVAWDCASDEYRKMAYEKMAEELERLRPAALDYLLEQTDERARVLAVALGWVPVAVKS